VEMDPLCCWLPLTRKRPTPLFRGWKFPTPLRQPTSPTSLTSAASHSSSLQQCPDLADDYRRETGQPQSPLQSPSEVGGQAAPLDPFHTSIPSPIPPAPAARSPLWLAYLRVVALESTPASTSCRNHSPNRVFVSLSLASAMGNPSLHKGLPAPYVSFLTTLLVRVS
jgi:hypothetical protein